jgi:hypothetical protein
MKTSPKPWWRTDPYEDLSPLPHRITALAGPNGVALVRAFGDGKTTKGWGDDEFMDNYLKGEFLERRALYRYERKGDPFAIVMRSVRMVAVDIDGKNGGLEHAKKLGALPPTLAETSKSGDGYHLFYELDDEWDDLLGYGTLHDRIGIEQGVDIRATGCVYHHASQRWNDREPAPMPDFLLNLLMSKQQERANRAAHVTKVLQTNDETEILLMRDQLISDLAKPVPAGKRNNTLFAIGQQMKQAQIDDWPELIEKRADEIGLDQDEIDKLVANIERYN